MAGSHTYADSDDCVCVRVYAHMGGRSRRKEEAGGGLMLLPALAHTGLHCFSLARPCCEVVKLEKRQMDSGWGGGLGGRKIARLPFATLRAFSEGAC